MASSTHFHQPVPFKQHEQHRQRQSHRAVQANGVSRPNTLIAKLPTTLVAAGVLTFLATPLSHALDLVGFTGITGPMVAALTQLAALQPGIKALVVVVGFIVALITLSALRNFSAVLFFLGMAIFGSVGLVIAGAIMGAVI